MSDREFQNAQDSGGINLSSCEVPGNAVNYLKQEIHQRSKKKHQCLSFAENVENNCKFRKTLMWQIQHLDHVSID